MDPPWYYSSCHLKIIIGYADDINIAGRTASDVANGFLDLKVMSENGPRNQYGKN